MNKISVLAGFLIVQFTLGCGEKPPEKLTGPPPKDYQDAAITKPAPPLPKNK